MADKDIAPELLERIRADFRALLGDAKPAADTYAAAADYAELVGSALAEAFRRNLTADALPDGRLYWNIADRVVRPLLEEEHLLVADASAAVQQALNRQANLGIAPQRAVLDTDAVDGLLNKVSTAKQFADVAWALDEPVRTFSRMVVDDTLKRNVDFQGKAGLRPRVIRTAESHCCKWCSALAGTYDYPRVPKDVYRCRVEYDPGEGRRQNVWNKTWTEDEDARQARREFAEIPLPNKVRLPQESPLQSVLPEYLRTASPGVGSITYDTGYDMARHTDEIKTAQWLHDHLGGDIMLLNEANNYKAMTPDYIWNGKLWDLKTASTEKSANSAVRHGLKQIQENPGGIILNYGQNIISVDSLKEVLRKRLTASATQNVDILVICKDELLTVQRFVAKK